MFVQDLLIREPTVSKLMYYIVACKVVFVTSVTTEPTVTNADQRVCLGMLGTMTYSILTCLLKVCRRSVTCNTLVRL